MLGPAFPRRFFFSFPHRRHQRALHIPPPSPLKLRAFRFTPASSELQGTWRETPSENWTCGRNRQLSLTPHLQTRTWRKLF